MSDPTRPYRQRFDTLAAELDRLTHHGLGDTATAKSVRDSMDWAWYHLSMDDRQDRDHLRPDPLRPS